MSRIYLDMDGVLADFDAGLRMLGIEPEQDLNKSRSRMTPEEAARKDMVYDAILAVPFFNQLPLMHDAQELWDFCAPFEPVILTAAPSRPEGFGKARIEKREWVEKHFGPIPDSRFICTNSSKKKLFVNWLPGNMQVLVDDRRTNVADWVGAGGTGIVHRSAAESIRELKRHLRLARTPRELAADAADGLLGTCMTLDALGDEYEAIKDNEEFTAALDARVGCCDTCSWWVDRADIDRDGDCEDCTKIEKVSW